jgi:outer membrane protein OmpA-like peptidoglycan-associated protein
MAQTFTMSNKCRLATDNANLQLTEKKYQEALDAFIALGKSCTTKDAREAAAVGKAEAYNGMGKYDEAIAASDDALKITKNKSLYGFFQKAIAQNKSGQIEASKATFANVITLTEKNKDTKARASNHALLSILNHRQLNENDSAYYYLDKAMELDPGKDEFNMTLSEKRAKAVSAYLVSKGVAASRLTEKWYGETQPKYANDNEENRQKNRRVELGIVANENMKADATNGKL